MLTITVEKKIAQLEARIAKLEGYGLLDKVAPRINYTLEPLATDLDFFRDPDQIKQSLSEFIKAKRERTAQAAESQSSEKSAEQTEQSKISADLLVHFNNLSNAPDTYQRQQKDEDDR